MSDTKALDISNLHAGYGETEILKGINLSVKPSEIVAIIGPNGAGKSTVVKSVLGLLNVISGDILLSGNNIVGIAPDKAIKKGISYVPQTHNIFPNLTITENLEMGAWTRTTGISERMDEMFELFPDLKIKRNKVAGSLSGGQRQMVAMAKALMVDSKIMLLDEPTAGVSPVVMDELFDKIIEIKKTGVAIIIVEQNAKQALNIADYGYVLVSGKNKFTGKGSDLLSNSEVRKAFLGG